jgi:hypothetical protein
VAIKAPLIPFIRTIAEAIDKYASEQGLAKSDYALVGTLDEKTDRISLIFGTDRQIDERQWYSGILRAIREALADYSWMTRNIGLVVENVRYLDEVYLESPGGDDEVELTELLERP